MRKWLILGVLVLTVAVAALFHFNTNREEAEIADPETRIIEYLRENVEPGRPVYITQLYNTVFTTPEERQVLERLHQVFFAIPAAAALIHIETGRMPTLEELSSRFQLKVPGEMDVLLAVMEADPRVPEFFERNPATGEIVAIDVDRIRTDEQFGKPLREQ